MPGITATDDFTCFPNPSDGPVHFLGTLDGHGPWELSIHDLAWRTVASVRLPSGRCDVDLQLPHGGIYIYVLHNADGMLRTGRVVVY